jgi:hypothetical protein
MIKNLFYDKYWAVAIPIFLEVLILCAILVFAGLVLILSKKEIVLDTEKDNKWTISTGSTKSTFNDKNKLE